jgi:acetyl/propionyl-CoA carboxylase alpha subunit
LCDEAFFIGAAASAQSYLSIEKVIDAAKKSKADAIHPGYGFLSEKAAFAEACKGAGLTFIGPSAKSIALMGSKVESRRAVARFGVPMVPGTMDPLTDETEARRIAAGIGYPVMLKASGGGGGKGLRLVRSESEIGDALSVTRAEAQAAFGDDAVYLEKYLQRPRHIEIQVLADQQGHAGFPRRAGMHDPTPASKGRGRVPITDHGRRPQATHG